MQIYKNSFKNQIILSLLVFAIFSILISAAIFYITDRIYRNRVLKEMENTTEVIAQSIDNFFNIPEKYLIAIKDHIEQIHIGKDQKDDNCIIIDVIEFMKVFEIVFLLNNYGSVLNTWPYEEDLVGIDMSNHEYYSQNPDQGIIYWSETFLSRRTGCPVVALTTGLETGQLVAYFNLAQLDEFISIELEEDTDFIAVMDVHGSIVAHSDSDQTLITENLGHMQSVRKAVSGTMGISQDYYKETSGFSSIIKADKSNFLVMVFKSYDTIYRKLNNAYTFFIIFMILISIVFGVIIVMIFRKFLRPLDRFQYLTKRVAEGTYEMLPDTNISELASLTESFSLMVKRIQEREKALKASIEDRETLLRELNHRTKNNMQLITGIMSLYNTQNPGSDPNGIMDKIQRKIMSIALVHDKLYKASDLSSINLREYLDELVPNLIRSLSGISRTVGYNLDIEDIFLVLDYAIPCGLILNELITNSLKYAFDSETEGLIRINGRINEDNRIEIRYTDNGKGLPPVFDITKTETLGFSIINNIVKSQLRGSYDIENSEGFIFTFKFNLDTFSKRF